ncbi:hypothetical protein Pla52o_40380 [Novipirellula galeiformis]|uniref:Uncharacterized protein n=1 Tax=Novipirellula galeiformis TaxID=2528004 RepID=A0A5C6CC74_9BACT|nr:hypothetical protein Pla52o_40380 [Novipirellula galeiformis]
MEGGVDGRLGIRSAGDGVRLGMAWHEGDPARALRPGGGADLFWGLLQRFRSLFFKFGQRWSSGAGGRDQNRGMTHALRVGAREGRITSVASRLRNRRRWIPQTFFIFPSLLGICDLEFEYG